MQLDLRVTHVDDCHQSHACATASATATHPAIADLTVASPVAASLAGVQGKHQGESSAHPDSSVHELNTSTRSQYKQTQSEAAASPQEATANTKATVHANATAEPSAASLQHVSPAAAVGATIDLENPGALQVNPFTADATAASTPQQLSTMDSATSVQDPTLQIEKGATASMDSAHTPSLPISHENSQPSVPPCTQLALQGHSSGVALNQVNSTPHSRAAPHQGANSGHDDTTEMVMSTHYSGGALPAAATHQVGEVDLPCSTLAPSTAAPSSSCAASATKVESFTTVTANTTAVSTSASHDTNTSVSTSASHDTNASIIVQPVISGVSQDVADVFPFANAKELTEEYALPGTPFGSPTVLNPPSDSARRAPSCAPAIAADGECVEPAVTTTSKPCDIDSRAANCGKALLGAIRPTPCSDTSELNDPVAPLHGDSCGATSTAAAAHSCDAVTPKASVVIHAKTAKAGIVGPIQHQRERLHQDASTRAIVPMRLMHGLSEAAVAAQASFEAVAANMVVGGRLAKQLRKNAVSIKSRSSEPTQEATESIGLVSYRRAASPPQLHPKWWALQPPRVFLAQLDGSKTTTALTSQMRSSPSSAGRGRRPASASASTLPMAGQVLQGRRPCSASASTLSSASTLPMAGQVLQGRRPCSASASTLSSASTLPMAARVLQGRRPCSASASMLSTASTQSFAGRRPPSASASASWAGMASEVRCGIALQGPIPYSIPLRASAQSTSATLPSEHGADSKGLNLLDARSKTSPLLWRAAPSTNAPSTRSHGGHKQRLRGHNQRLRGHAEDHVPFQARVAQRAAQLARQSPMRPFLMSQVAVSREIAPRQDVGLF